MITYHWRAFREVSKMNWYIITATLCEQKVKPLPVNISRYFTTAKDVTHDLVI